MKRKLRVSWVCEDCGNKYGNPLNSHITYHEGTCDVCKREGMIAPIREYNYVPRLPAEMKYV